jgi:hypothetical protein
MKTEKKKAAAPTATQKQTLHRKSYMLEPGLSSNRCERIKKRRADIPRSYRRLCDKTLSGKNLEAAVNAQCLECMNWQCSEVKDCESFSCPLWTYKPHQQNLLRPAVGRSVGAESRDATQWTPQDRLR